MGKGGEADEVKKGCPFVEATKGIENFEDIIHGSPPWFSSIGGRFAEIRDEGIFAAPLFYVRTY